MFVFFFFALDPLFFRKGFARLLAFSFVFFLFTLVFVFFTSFFLHGVVFFMFFFAGSHVCQRVFFKKKVFFLNCFVFFKGLFSQKGLFFISKQIFCF